MDQTRLSGILAALFAAFAWSLNFVVPFVIGRYTVFDFALLRFGFSGLVGFGLLLSIGGDRHLSMADWAVAAWLAFIGYVGYFLMVAAAALYAGPIIAPAFLGMVPIVLGVIGNYRQRSVAWRRLLIPLSMAAVGLVLVNSNAFGEQGSGSEFSWAGVSLSLGAVALWTWFAIANQAALACRPDMNSTIWAVLILVAGGLEMLLFFPFGAAAGLFRLPELGLGWSVAGNLYLWGISLALLASVGGVWAWNVAARNLPIALAAQLIVSETAFGAIFGLSVHGRWPSVMEAIGIVLLIAGVVVAIPTFYPRSLSLRQAA